MKAWFRDVARHFLGLNSVDARFHSLENRMEVLEVGDETTDFDKLNGQQFEQYQAINLLKNRVAVLENPAVPVAKKAHKGK